MFVVLVAEFESVSVLRLCKNPGETEVVLGRRVHRTSDVKPLPTTAKGPTTVGLGFRV